MSAPSTQAFAAKSLDIRIPAPRDDAPRGLKSPHVLLSAENRAWQLAVHLHDRSKEREVLQLLQAAPTVCVIGDYQEATANGFQGPAVNATLIHVDLRSSKLHILTPITGLPPVFIFRQSTVTHISTPFLPAGLRGSIAPDPQGIADALRWGHPIDGRTLFSNLTLVPSSTRISIGDSSRVASEAIPVGEPDADVLRLSRADLVEEQLAAFGRSARRLPGERSFVSLTGGLDSRTSLVGLLSAGRSAPCVTMASSDLSLDLRLAKAVCSASQLDHNAIIFDGEFLGLLPDLVLQAAELTGGVASINQTADLYLYRKMGDGYDARISGNLGNQVGRGGFESLSAYSPDIRAFSPTVRELLESRPRIPWFIDRLRAPHYGDVLFGQEIQYWSAANYMAGSAYATQLTPYADRRLLELSRAAFLRDPRLQSPTWKTLRARDLRHRFAGTPRKYSFQRRFLVAHGARVARVPLNWGWFASGGWSPKWLASAMISAADAAIIKYSRSHGPLQPVARFAASRSRHRSALVDWRKILQNELRDLTLESVRSSHIADMDIFDRRGIATVLTEHFSGAADHHYTVLRSLEIALAFLSRLPNP